MKPLFTRLARPLTVLVLIASSATLPACVARVQRVPVRSAVVVAPRGRVVVARPAPVYVAPAPRPRVYVAPRPAPARVYVAPRPGVRVYAGPRGRGRGRRGPR